MKIIIGASSPINWKPFSWLIKWYTKRPYSHAYIKYSDSITGQIMIAESSHGEFHKITEANWQKINRSILEYSVEIPGDSYYLIMRRINNALQVDYSKLNIIGIPFYDLYEKTNLIIFLKIALKFSDKANKLICSEAVAFILALLGVAFTKPFDFLKPGDIFDAIESEIEKGSEEYAKIL